MAEPIDIVILFVFGSIIGSFLNALLFRYNTGRSMWGRSACLSCGVSLKAHHLVPIFSYLGLRGKCASCKTRISPQYPLVEMLAGALTVFCFTSAGGSTAPFIVSLGFFTILLFISVYDIRHTIIPDGFVYGALVLALGAAWFGITPASSVLMAVSAAVVLSAPLALLWVVSKGRWIGLGDAKLLAACGAWLGLSQGAAAFLLAFWLGAAFGIAALGIGLLGKSRGGVTMKSEVPFGPFIVLAAALAYFCSIGLYDILSFVAF